ncbi:unnamed protein product, partial [Brassica rapa]
MNNSGLKIHLYKLLINQRKKLKLLEYSYLLIFFIYDSFYVMWKCV